jgi:hypothetical protein
MRSRTLISAIALAALTTAPAFADDGQRHRGGGRSGNRSSEARQAPAPEQRRDDRAVARNDAPREREGRPQYQAPRQNERPRQYQVPRQNEIPRQYQAPRRNEFPRQYQAPREYAMPRQYEARRRGYEGPRFNDRRFDGRRFGSARIIRPTIIQVVPYRPYSYHPRWSLGVYYGVGGSYPYGYTPRGYYDPIPGRYYGGLRITGAARDAQVFADGYFVGIVDDFDGIFQHVNLEAGPHHIEIVEGGFEPIAFDVNVRPGETITFRAEMYRPY